MEIKPTNYELPEGYTHLYSGKVRDLYRTPENQLLFVASDRISAYDWVMPTEIPDKGKILTALSIWWFDQLKDIVPNHVISTDVPDSVAGRAMICKSLDMFPVECVARGYLTGSGLVEYKACCKNYRQRRCDCSSRPNNCNLRTSRTDCSSTKCHFGRHQI
jgi:phosphoribosylaminoimidazole-succinocarboxamide synthase